MRRHLMLAVLLGLAVMALSSPVASAQNCNSAPTGYGGAWWKSYSAWCSACGGTPNPAKTSCTPGPNWGRRGGNGAPDNSAAEAAAANAAAQAEAEAERQRQEQLLREQEEERQRREAEERKRRQDEFERNKQQAVRDMKGISGELGLKGLDSGGFGLKGIAETGGGGFGLKDAPSDSPATALAKPPECKWGDQDSSVVDLRCLGLDPDKPIVVDPHVVRGQQRVFPAQIDPATFQNANYNKGFEALMRLTLSVQDAQDAVAYFKAAKLQRPNDPLVRNALYLADGILEARQQKEKDDQAKVAELTKQAYAGLISGETGSARSFITRARELDPNNANLRFLDTVMTIVGPESTTASTPERRAAYKIVANSLVSISRQNDAAAVAMLQAAQHLQPQDKFIGTLLLSMKNYEAGRSEQH